MSQAGSAEPEHRWRKIAENMLNCMKNNQKKKRHILLPTALAIYDYFLIILMI